MKTKSLILFLLCFFAAPVAALAADCSKCNAYPPLCGDIENCVKNCNLSNFQAFNCYHAGLISLAECQKVYDLCVDGPPCLGCGGYPSSCSKIATCVKSCNMAPFQAQNCMMDGYISLDDCKKIYPGCQKTEHDTQCKQDCGAYPPLCGKIDHCVKDCNLAPFQAQNCYHSGIIPLDKCKQIYPQCQ